jgi:hypothetical protein
MLELNRPPQLIPFENIEDNTSTSGYVDKLIVFLQTHYTTFPQKYKVAIEEDISEKLWQHFQRQSRLNDAPFEFQPETPQRFLSKKGHKRRADFGVNLNTFDIDMELIYCIEAKRLPTGKVGSKREKEYVFGDGGGIQRFKENKHGIGRKGNLLQRNGIVGYVQSDNFSFWHKTINQWILDDPTWDNSEALSIGNFSAIAQMESTHERISGDKLHLTHFWINLC